MTLGIDRSARIAARHGMTPGERLTRLRRRLNLLFDRAAKPSTASRVVNAALATLIVSNVAAVVLESVTAIRLRYSATLWWFEQISVGFYTIEYVLRLWTAVDRASGKYRRPVVGRLRYAVRPLALVDLAAILPPLLGGLFLDDLRVLRLLRLMRMLKLTRHSTALRLLYKVIREEARSLGAVLFLLSLVLIMSASLMYMIENEAQPAIFSSIPAAMWWSLVTLTTVGYGDMVPSTVLGKILGGFVAIIGVATLALLSGVLTAGFMDQIRMRREQYRHLVEGRVHGHRLTHEEADRIQQLGTSMGVGATDIASIMDHALQAHPGACPNCGHRLMPNRNPGAESH